ncbi:unnamed protein product [Lepeophtheirus salmonis]|uniref:(salmon louse) hypothetical protein n=1 Tax=Lepeophtheirus salmonis TaxID=72036 RepID=A0A7R8CG37_LEPSM|nr:unnamed protein product [Lepeophtheirus salmonis]CAF2812238.1 unnamed protein product [Lepeophtheirus salmonis]
MSEHIAEKPLLISIAQGSHTFGSQLLFQINKPEQNALKEIHFKQIKDALRLPEDMESLKSAYSHITSLTKSDDNITLEIANSVFPSSNLELRKEYLRDVKKHFQSDIQVLNFRQTEEARRILNDWVLKETNGKVNELFKLGSIRADTLNVLVNAIYFKGDWLVKFNPGDTTVRNFYVSPEKTVKVPTMFASDIKYAVTHNDDLKCKIVALPYKGERITMYFFIPDEKFGLRELEQKLSTSTFNPSILETLTHRMKTPIYLPKFKLESYYDLQGACKSLGLTDMFNKNSDFSGMVGEPGDLYVSKIVQMAVIEVNEEGCEAAGATGMVGFGSSMPQPLVINHPFIFMIKDKASGHFLMISTLICKHHPSETAIVVYI